MRTSRRVGLYAVGLVAVLGGAFAVGAVVGKPMMTNPPSQHASHRAASAPSSAPAGLQVAQNGYRLTAIEAPTAEGAAGPLSFQILDPDGRPVTAYDDLHTKRLHLIVVRQDTQEFRHVHPALESDGTWSIDWSWPSGGSYKVFADFQPSATGESLTLARNFEVSGSYAPVAIPRTEVTSEVAGYAVTLSGELAPGRSEELTVTVEKGGEPVTDLEPYLGAYGHLVALRAGDLAYLHVHPAGEPGDGSTQPGPEVTFAAEAPSVGTYRLFFDFQAEGEVHTAEFTIEAQQRPSSEHAEEPAGGGTDQHGDH